MRELGNLTFGGIDFSAYGVVISGTGTYNAPERDITKYEVPGRNGDLIQDNGRFKNITVTYPCNITEDFADRADAFRKALKSKIGYQQMIDTYHPNEYRMGVMVDEIEFVVGALEQRGTVDISFDCKPQRFYLDTGLPETVTGTTAPMSYEFVKKTDLSSYLQENFGSRLEKNLIILNQSGSSAEIYYDKRGVYEQYVICSYDSPKTAESSISFYASASEGHISSEDQFAASYKLLNGYPTNITIGEGKIFPDSLAIGNISDNTSKPLIEINTGGADFSDNFHYVCGINEKNAILLNTPSYIVYNNKRCTIGIIYIDVETMDCYMEAGGIKVSLNKYVKIIGDLELKQGTNTIYTNNEVTYVKVYPRFYTI